MDNTVIENNFLKTTTKAEYNTLTIGTHIE